MEPWSFEAKGRTDEHVVDSRALRGNALGDPHERPGLGLHPPGYDDDTERRYPSVYVIQGLTGQLDAWRNRSPFRRNFPSSPTTSSHEGKHPGDRGLGGLLDVARRQSVPRLARHGNYLTTLRRDRAVRGRALPHDRHRDHRGIQGKSAAATARWWSPCSAPILGTRHHAAGDALRGVLPPDFRESARVLRCPRRPSKERSRPAFSKDGWNTAERLAWPRATRPIPTAPSSPLRYRDR